MKIKDQLFWRLTILMGIKYAAGLLELITWKSTSLQNNLWKWQKDSILNNTDQRALTAEAGENTVNLLNNKS